MCSRHCHCECVKRENCHRKNRLTFKKREAPEKSVRKPTNLQNCHVMPPHTRARQSVPGVPPRCRWLKSESGWKWQQRRSGALFLTLLFYLDLFINKTHRHCVCSRVCVCVCVWSDLIWSGRYYCVGGSPVDGTSISGCRFICHSQHRWHRTRGGAITNRQNDIKMPQLHWQNCREKNDCDIPTRLLKINLILKTINFKDAQLSCLTHFISLIISKLYTW